jgi:hypothetical protein
MTGPAMQISTHYYSFLKKLIVLIVYKHGNICIAGLNRCMGWLRH